MPRTPYLGGAFQAPTAPQGANENRGGKCRKNKMRQASRLSLHRNAVLRRDRHFAANLTAAAPAAATSEHRSAMRPQFDNCQPAREKIPKERAAALSFGRFKDKGFKREKEHRNSFSLLWLFGYFLSTQKVTPRSAFPVEDTLVVVNGSMLSVVRTRRTASLRYGKNMPPAYFSSHRPARRAG